MIVEKAYAKVNLALDVVRKRNDGYHDLKMIMVPLELHDILSFELHNDIVLESNIDIEDNAIVKTVKLMQQTYNVSQGVKITLEKNIPIGAGLAGGSADIAATLRGVNRLWDLNLEMNILEEIALKLGSDTLFCLHNKAAYVYGRGENMLFIASPPIQSIYLIDSGIHVSTKEVFEHHVVQHELKKFNRLFTLYVNEKYQQFFKLSYNVLTKTTKKLYEEVAHVEKQVKKISPLARMSGSGSIFYIPIFKENERKIAKKIENLPFSVVKSSVKH